MLVADSHPSLFKSKTADQARFMENKAYMSATDAAAHKGVDALGRCGLTALPPANDTFSSSQRLLEVHQPSHTAALLISTRISTAKNNINSEFSKDTTIFLDNSVLGKRKRAHKACNKPSAAVTPSQTAHNNFEGSSCYVNNKEAQSMTLCDSTKVTASLLVVSSACKRRRGTAEPPIPSSIIRGTVTEDHLSELMAHSAQGQPDDNSIVGPVSADDAMILALKNAAQTPHILGVNSRKLKSLKFRLRRRELKIVQSGTPFNKRDCLKNTNR